MHVSGLTAHPAPAPLSHVSLPLSRHPAMRRRSGKNGLILTVRRHERHPFVTSFRRSANKNFKSKKEGGNHELVLRCGARAGEYQAIDRIT
ncbi:hypothetical protein EMIT0158MI4_180034 [Burkholderia ambifaria]